MWYVLFFLNVALFIFLVGFLLPRRFFKVTYSVNATRDFGLKKKHADDLDCVVYQPAKDIRQYVSQYILVKRDGKLVFKCKADEQITRLDYDIVCFGVDHKAIHSVNIVDDIAEAGYSSEVELPQDTAYVTLLVNSVNGKSLGNKSRLRLSFWNMFLFTILSALVICLETVVARICFGQMFAGVFGESYVTATSNVIKTAISAAVLIVAYWFVTVGVLIHKVRSWRRKK